MNNEEIIALLHRCKSLVRLVTIKQVIEAGDEEITAAGLNPWCINEGLSDGTDTIEPWWITDAIEKLKQKPLDDFLTKIYSEEID